MSNMVTRCPKCATSFRITRAQLHSAKGAVRCGSCLHIFKADDHLVTVDAENSSTSPVATPTTATTATPPHIASTAPTLSVAPADPVIELPAVEAPPPSAPGVDTLAFDQDLIDEELAALDDDILISDDMHQTHPALADDPFDDFLVDRPATSISLFERDLSQIKEPEITDSTDESWAESLLDEADDEARFEAVKHHLDSIENDRTHFDLTAAPDDNGFSLPPHQPGYPGQMFSLIDDGRPAEVDTTEGLPQDLTAQFPATQEYEPEHLPVKAPGETPMRAYDTSRAALLMNIMPEPVVMTGRNKRRARQKRLWLSLSIVMLVVLAVQVAWLQFDNLSRLSPYRSFYGWICPHLGCELPTLVDKSEIRVRNLLVRKHPEVPNALILDVIVLNTAPFAQPFPDLVMEFSDIDEVTLAARRFTPPEYLRGELAGHQLMPQNQPVHVSLELVDPGEAAVNYKIQPY